MTILRKPEGGEWQSVIGPGESEESPPPGQVAFPEQAVTSIAAEPGTSSAWLGLDGEEDVPRPKPSLRASLARVASDGAVSDRLELPLPKTRTARSARRSASSARPNTTAGPAPSDGWLLHLATPGERGSPNVLADSVFERIENGEPDHVPPAATQACRRKRPTWCRKTTPAKKPSRATKNSSSRRKEEPARVTGAARSRTYARGCSTARSSSSPSTSP